MSKNNDFNIDFSPLERSLSGLLKSTGSYYESTLKNQEEEIRNNPQNVNSNDDKKIQYKQNINNMSKETIKLLTKLINKGTLLCEKDESSFDDSPPQNEEQKDIQKEPRRKQILQEEESNYSLVEFILIQL